MPNPSPTPPNSTENAASPAAGVHSFLNGKERELLVAGLQALWRERVAAFNITLTAANLGDRSPPYRGDFGIDEVSDLLARVGAKPVQF